MWRRGWPIAAFAGVMSESFWWLGPVCDVALIVAYSFLSFTQNVFKAAGTCSSCFHAH
jgi:hypothetical protein